MTYNHNFLWILCVTTAIVSCCNNDVFAGALQHLTLSSATETQQNIQSAINLTNRSEVQDAHLLQTKKICAKGYYVAQCGRYRVGFNWLKNAKFPRASDSGTDVYETNNYYVYDDVIDLFKQMRNFFDNSANPPTSIIGTTSYNIPVDPDNPTYIDPQEDRELILNSLCHPALVQPVCKKCPDGGTTQDASTVTLDYEGLSVPGSWHIHTIADCYMDEFEDSTGTYVYLPPVSNIDPATAQAENCYYTNTNQNAINALNGDEIQDFVPGIDTSSEIHEFVIPSSNYGIRRF